MLDSYRYGFCVVVNDRRIVLGRLRRSTLAGADPDAPVEQVMEPGPSTVRPSMDARQLVERNLGAAIVTTPEGVLVGIFDRAEAERRLAKLRA